MQDTWKGKGMPARYNVFIYDIFIPPFLQFAQPSALLKHILSLQQLRLRETLAHLSWLKRNLIGCLLLPGWGPVAASHTQSPLGAFPTEFPLAAESQIGQSTASFGGVPRRLREH